MKNLIFILLLIPFFGQAFDTDTIHGNWAYVDSLKSLRSVNATAVCGIDSNNTIGRCNCQCVLHVRDSISSYQILHSFSTPDTLIAAPGAGYFIAVQNVSIYYHYTTAAYTISAVNGIFEGSTVYPFNQNSSTVLGYTSDYWVPMSYNASTQPTNPVNKPVIFYSTSSNPTGGGGYLIIYIDYLIEKY